MQEKQDTTTSVRVTAPARLHLGFLDPSGQLGRRFGSIGLAIDEPATEITVRPSAEETATGEEQERALRHLRNFSALLSARQTYAVEVHRAIPAHAGLGSGTQLALAIAAGLMRLEGRKEPLRWLAEQAERGARSAIGIAAFETGGFVIDGGKGASDKAPPVIARVDYPEDWRILLILDQHAQGVHGDQEAEAFANLPPFPGAKAARLCHLALLKLLPGLAEADIVAFGNALTEIQEAVGGHFAAAQGGSAWTSPSVGQIAEQLKSLGAAGIGQSSWGPTGFACVSSQTEAMRLYTTLVEEAKAMGLELKVVRGRGVGARISKV